MVSAEHKNVVICMVRVRTPEQNFSNVYSIPTDATLGSRAAGLPH